MRESLDRIVRNAMAGLEFVDAAGRKRKMSQRELARRAGLAASSLHHLFKHPDAVPRPETVVQIADALGLSREHLLEAAGYCDAPPTSEEALRKRAVQLLRQSNVLQSQHVEVATLLLTLLWENAMARQQGVVLKAPEPLPMPPAPKPGRGRQPGRYRDN